MMQIILARHGKTEWNVKQVFRGRVDVGLNETGRKEAELLAGYLSIFAYERNRFIFTRHNENCFLASLNIPPAEDF
ncbi:MAG: histidine phosphatase family protein [Dehalococcoidales bacterium]|nr:histidine phosphatase family protein [Dehalococcoidales bacterium]